MEDKYVKAKTAARKQMMLQVENDKAMFIRKMKNGLGDVLVKEIDKNKQPMLLKQFWYRLLKVLGG